MSRYPVIIVDVPTPTRARPRILVADDDELLCALLEHKLEEEGYVVDLVDNGLSALENAKRLCPGLIVLDAMMPVMDGFEALRRLKADPQLYKIPVVVLTAMKREVDIVTALKLGAADYLSKPFIPQELIARIKRLTPALQDDDG